MKFEIIFVLISSFLWIAVFTFFFIKKFKRNIFDALLPSNVYMFFFILYYPIGIIVHWIIYIIGDNEKLWFSNVNDVIEGSPYILLYSLSFFSVFYIINIILGTIVNKKLSNKKVYIFFLPSKILHFYMIFIALLSVFVSYKYISVLGGLFIFSGYDQLIHLRAGYGFLKILTYVTIYIFTSYILLLLRIKGFQFFPYLLSFFTVAILTFIFGERKSALLLPLILVLYDIFNKKLNIKVFIIVFLIGILILLWSIFRNTISGNFPSIDRIRIISFLISYVGSYSHLEPLNYIINNNLSFYAIDKLIPDYLIYYVPRFIFPEKPLTLGAQGIISPLLPIEEGLTAAPSSIGEAIIAYGYIGIILYVFLHFIIVKIFDIIYIYTFNKWDGFFFLLVYSYMVYIVQGMHRSGILGFVSEMFSLIIIFAFILLYRYFNQILKGGLNK